MSPIDALRTPDDRFTDLPDFPCAPNYITDLRGYEGLRAHYLDLGPRDADQTFLCLHGQPTWSFLYRKMIPVLLESGARVLAPDLFGFGRSDKPVQDPVYTFHFHRDFLLRFVERMNIRNITMVVQDWGGTLGLTLPVDSGFRARLSRLLVMNTVLPIGEPLGPHFYEWRSLVRSMPDPPVGQLMRGAEPSLSDRDTSAYDAPFPHARFKAGVRTFPDLAMVKPSMEGVAEAREAARFWAQDWSGQSFMAIGANDPDMATMRSLRTGIRGCPEPMILPEAGHFVQEHGEVVARAAVEAFAGDRASV